MPDNLAARNAATPVLYVTETNREGVLDSVDLFDLAFMLRSWDYEVQGVCVGATAEGFEAALGELTAVTGRKTIPVWRGVEGFAKALDNASASISVVAVGGYEVIAAALTADQARFRATIARLFIVGGFANDYAEYPQEERLPIDPRLRDREPERFAPTGDSRATIGSPAAQAWARLLVSGEGVIWLPRDICLWRYFAPGLLAGGGATAEFLLNAISGGRDNVGGDAQTPVYLSALPALLLARQPDPFTWMRLFRAVTMRADADAETGRVTAITTRTDTPNLYAVVAIDGAALTKMLTARLRD